MAQAIDAERRRELFGDSDSDSDSGSDNGGESNIGSSAAPGVGGAGGAGAGGATVASSTSRPASNGPMQFHEGTEEELVAAAVKSVAKRDLEQMVQFIDQFCLERHWMMNLGDEKGALYSSALSKCGSKLGLELGMYCGYSTLRALVAMGDGSRMVCIDPNAETNALAQRLFEHAGVADRVRVVEGVLAKKLAELEADSLVFDHVFIDHDKAAYLPDLLLLESSSLLRPGTVLFADNVVVFRIEDYLARANDSRLYRDQELHHTLLEYSAESDNIRDGVHIAYWKGEATSEAAS